MGKETTGTRDKTYDLISVVYHSLQAANAGAIYLEDAKKHGDHEAEEFLESVIAANRDLATRGKKLLMERLDRHDEKSADEVVDQTIDESFPASDAPANY